VPDAPQKVKVEEIRNETVELSWQSPENDGGSPITGYFIERCELIPNLTTQLWTRSGMSKSTIHLVENLQANHKYQFRVIAENAQGRSQPSEPTDCVLVQGNV
jgi:titin